MESSMKKHLIGEKEDRPGNGSFLFRHLKRLMLIITLGIVFLNTTPVFAKTNEKIQELQGFLEGGLGMVYALSNLKKGDTLHAYMANTSGNLDPMLGLLIKAGDHDVIHEKILKAVVNADHNFVEAFARFADDHFRVWDDDNGDGYDAMLQFSIPADGTYFIFAGSMITNQSVDAFSPGFTSGSYRLLLGLNAPGVNEGKGKPSGKSFAAAESSFGERPSHVQHLEQKLTADKRLTFHHLKIIHPGDSIYARLENKRGQPLPRLFLSDFGGKPLVFGKKDTPSNAVMFSYHSQKGAAGLNLYIDGTGMDKIPEAGEYHLVVGINEPEVLKGGAVAQGLPVFMKSENVTIGLSIEQIVNVDQQSENFTIVGSLQLAWQDPALAFSPDKCNCAIKKMVLKDLKSISNKNGIFLPLFTFYNQQGNRWSQSEIVFIEPSGRTTYRERFTVTLQAPGFDFSTYPFDRQIFNVRIDLDVPAEVFVFQGVENPSRPLGNQLGEEEWSVNHFSQEVKNIPYDKNLTKSRFTMSMEMKRHLNFYIFRIFLPLFLIISVSWVIFFLKDYGKQLEVASGNLLVFVAFNFTISKDLPRLGYLTLMDRMIIGSFCCTALVVFISVWQKRLEARGKKELASRIDNYVLVLYPLAYMLLIIFEYFRVTSKTVGLGI